MERDDARGRARRLALMLAALYGGPKDGLEIELPNGAQVAYVADESGERFVPENVPASAAYVPKVGLYQKRAADARVNVGRARFDWVGWQ